MKRSISSNRNVPVSADLYYVGFAGDGYQRVFRREALLGQRIFGDRLGTGPRSLELINDYQDRESFPPRHLRWRCAMRYAEIGKAMDPNEDVLVLFLTSHGSQEDGVYIRNGVSWLDSDLPPDEVRSALDDAGIRWRIVVVSACYSGRVHRAAENGHNDDPHGGGLPAHVLRLRRRSRLSPTSVKPS